MSLVSDCVFVCFKLMYFFLHCSYPCFKPDGFILYTSIFDILISEVPGVLVPFFNCQVQLRLEVSDLCLKLYYFKFVNFSWWFFTPFEVHVRDATWRWGRLLALIVLGYWYSACWSLLWDKVWSRCPFRWGENLKSLLFWLNYCITLIHLESLVVRILEGSLLSAVWLESLRYDGWMLQLFYWAQIWRWWEVVLDLVVSLFSVNYVLQVIRLNFFFRQSRCLLHAIWDWCCPWCWVVYEMVICYNRYDLVVRNYLVALVSAFYSTSTSWSLPIWLIFILSFRISWDLWDFWWNWSDWVISSHFSFLCCNARFWCLWTLPC